MYSALAPGVCGSGCPTYITASCRPLLGVQVLKRSGTFVNLYAQFSLWPIIKG